MKQLVTEVLLHQIRKLVSKIVLCHNWNTRIALV
jgi:hypothetical protein